MSIGAEVAALAAAISVLVVGALVIFVACTLSGRATAADPKPTKREVAASGEADLPAFAVLVSRSDPAEGATSFSGRIRLTRSSGEGESAGHATGSVTVAFSAEDGQFDEPLVTSASPPVQACGADGEEWKVMWSAAGGVALFIPRNSLPVYFLADTEWEVELDGWSGSPVGLSGDESSPHRSAEAGPLRIDTFASATASSPPFTAAFSALVPSGGDASDVFSLDVPGTGGESASGPC